MMHQALFLTCRHKNHVQKSRTVLYYVAQEKGCVLSLSTTALWSPRLHLVCSFAIRLWLCSFCFTSRWLVPPGESLLGTAELCSCRDPADTNSPAVRGESRQGETPLPLGWISGICCPTLVVYALLPSEVICLNSPNPRRVEQHESRQEVCAPAGETCRSPGCGLNHALILLWPRWPVR